MSYRIRFHHKARVELDLCCETYPCMREPLWLWLHALAEEAEHPRDRFSFDIEDLPPYLAKAFEPFESSWEYTVDRLGEATWGEDMKAILKIVRTRRPPWQLRAAWRAFAVLGATFHCWPIVFFDVDHVGKQVVIRLFDGLPGQ